MSVGSIFFDINLPNPPTWFYFSGLLAVALFVKFSRLLTVRNLDVLLVFLPMPGLLLLLEGGTHTFWGYLALMLASLALLARCLFDLTLVRRPALAANLDTAGMGWLAGALFVSLIAVAARAPSKPDDQGSQSAPPGDKVLKALETTVQPFVPPEVDRSTLGYGVERGLTLVGHLSVVVGLVLVGWRHFKDLQAGMSAATFYLLLPYTYLLLPATPLGQGRWNQPWPMAFLVWAVFCYRSPSWAGLFLGAATGTTIFPVVCLPTWLSFYRERGAGRFLAGYLLCAGLILGAVGCVSWVNGELPKSLRAAWALSDWQPWKMPAPGTRGFWQDIPSESVSRMPAPYRLPVFIAYAALVLTTGFWPAPKNLAHVLALSAAVLIGTQFWYADHGGVYVLWYLPFLLLLAFRPNLSGAVPPVPSDGDRYARAGRWLLRQARKLLRIPEPVGAGRG